MYFSIRDAEYLKDYRIKLTFDDGSTGVADLSSYPDPSNVFKAFLNLEYFRAFRIDYGTLVWGNGEVDIAPEALYAMATGKPVTYRALHTGA